MTTHLLLSFSAILGLSLLTTLMSTRAAAVQRVKVRARSPRRH